MIESTKLKKNMIKEINKILMSFRKSFARYASFQWFIVVVIGLIIVQDGYGVTSIIRELFINPSHYENLLHFFRSRAWSIEKITQNWIKTVHECAPVLRVLDGRNILIGDGTKVSKEGKKMPCVKKLHQESENSGKSNYIFGHMFGIVSLLIGNVHKQFALPLSASIQDGDSAIRGFSGETEIPSHVVRIITESGNITKHIGKSILLLDRYFLSSPAIKKMLEYAKGTGDSLLEIVTKAKISTVAYLDPPTYSGKGRPRLKGAKVKLRDLFSNDSTEFITEELYLYGKTQKVQYHCVDLLWGTKLYKKLRFVLVKTENYASSILVSTSLALSPLQIIELYSYRYKIEISFKVLKNVVAGFCYHFWSAYMPKLDRYNKENNMRAIDSITNDVPQQKISETLKAIEGFVMFSCIATGILQMLSIKFSGDVDFFRFRWLRTRTNIFVSEESVACYLRKNLNHILLKYRNLAIVQIIMSKQSSILYKDSISA
jgi:hypothetical protein